MSHASRLLVALPDYAELKLESSRTRNQAYGANSLNCLQTKQHGIDLGAYLGRRPSSSLHDILAHLIIIPNGDVEGETARP